MKTSVRRVVAGVQLMAARLQCRIVSALFKHRRVLVLDIDNTIADSWPTLVAPSVDERQRLSTLALLPGMKAHTFDRAQRRGDLVVFLSHRSLRWWLVTWRWLRAHHMSVSPLCLWCVPGAEHKVELLATLCAHHEVEVWDDLHHLHETGTAQAYRSVIEALESLPLEYHGVRDIEAVVAQAAGSSRSPHRTDE